MLSTSVGFASSELVAPSAAPTGVVATPGANQIRLTWNSVSGATSYRVYRATTGSFSRIATISTTSYTNTSLVSGTSYRYYVRARDNSGEGPASAIVVASPLQAPAAPSSLTAVGGNQQVALTWSGSAEATSYKVYRSLTSGSYSSTPTATVSAPTLTFTDTGLQNGPQHFYTVIASNANGNSARSPQASAFTEAPAPVVDAATTAAFRLLRQATWGPKPGDVDRVKLIGQAAFLDEQFAAAITDYPDTLLTLPLVETQKHLVQTALTAPDQLRQRVAWTLQKIWVVSANDANAALGMVAYERLFVRGAFGNYRDLMEAVTLNPAMGRYLTMLNNRSQAVTGAAANENYARELMQLFTLGTTRLNDDGTTLPGADGLAAPAYTQGDVLALARILTGWTFGDGNPATIPTRLASANYVAPMEPVAAFHDTTAKVFLGESFAAGGTAVNELERALDIIFQHPNVGPFVSAQLIRQLVTSNPSPGYVRDIAAVFNNNGSGVRGDLAAVIRAILLHSEASATAATSGKLEEPLLFITNVLRSLNATVTNAQDLIDRGTEMGQRVLHPPSVFSYFSPGFVVHGTSGSGGAPLTGPEFQILTGVTSFERANFLSRLLGGSFGTNVAVDYTPFTSRASNPSALVDYCNLIFMGGRMSAAARTEIIAAVRTTTSTTERMRTALYLTLSIAQFQVDR